MMYKFTDDKHGIRQIQLIEFQDNQHFDEFIAEVSDLLWGESGAYEDLNGDTVCDTSPHTVEETLDRLHTFVKQSLAWTALAMRIGADPFDPPHMDNDTEEDFELRELMQRIHKEVEETMER